MPSSSEVGGGDDDDSNSLPHLKLAPWKEFEFTSPFVHQTGNLNQVKSLFHSQPGSD